MRLPGYDEAARRIAAARRTGATQLDLRHLHAGAIPPEIAALTSLRELDLAGNGLTGLPDLLAGLANLEVLNAAKNSLTGLPASFRALNRIRALDLGYNRCESVPQAVLAYRALRTLNLSFNPIRRLPREMADLENLRTLSLNGMTELLEPPPAVLSRGLTAVRAYLREQAKAAVRRLRAGLPEAWIDAWLDEAKLLPGQKWAVEIPKAVRVSHVVIVCLSAGSANKEGFLQREIRIALDAAEEKPEGTIYIVPARLEASPLPDRLAEYQWVDLFEDTGMPKLIQALALRARQTGIPYSGRSDI